MENNEESPIKKEQKKVIDMIEASQIRDVGDEFPEIDVIGSDDQDPSELTSGTDSRDDKGNGEEVEPIVKDPRFSKGHTFAPETLDPLNTGKSKASKTEIHEEETETEE
jgi:hypothetical protein